MDKGAGGLWGEGGSLLCNVLWLACGGLCVSLWLFPTHGCCAVSNEEPVAVALGGSPAPNGGLECGGAGGNK